MEEASADERSWRSQFMMHKHQFIQIRVRTPHSAHLRLEAKEHNNKKALQFCNAFLFTETHEYVNSNCQMIYYTRYYSAFILFTHSLHRCILLLVSALFPQSLHTLFNGEITIVFSSHRMESSSCSLIPSCFL